ncbi:MAG: hypothetical protein K2I05_09485 [Mailhella sp.]|nr:hypothetical protein [Mailhella sp.]
MQERQLSAIWAVLLGLCWPGASLLCTGKAKQALLIGFLLVFYAFFLAFMPVRFIILTLYLYIIVHVIALLYGLAIGLLEARKPKKEIIMQDMASEMFFFLVFMLLTVFLIFNTPVKFYKVQQDFAHVGENDIVVVQEKIPLIGHHYNDSVIFYTDNFEERLGVVKAVAGDVLEFNDGILYRNGNELAKIASFPIKKFIVPDNLLLIEHDKEKDIHAEENEQFETQDTKTLTFLTAHRIKGKALFVLYSTSLKNIGKRLVFATVAR